ncbi:hypothetical protein Emin_0462 [Elusimicrobium minutum Pei191]|uniref:DUF2019 domain-containing protein n=1 Tax=Elusimicrobium minutum (strain Pei191) TaxID=445932 RepID=B2KBJ7_ELUMP|nr:hypothetical protein [Elusimicrobium minutum]ACC98019.1 hypothetical protein Emin_0462 [Elusimicrobium minutum Pei191]
MRENDIDKILIDFKHAAIENWTAQKNCDSKKANKYADKLIKIKEKLKKIGKLIVLKELLVESSPIVRSWAATYLLAEDENLAIKALEKLIAERGEKSFAAEMVLNEWRNGKLNP